MKNKTMIYEMQNYDRKSTFSSFLPGIAGIHGIPIWCCYVNRGQGVVSFGVDNKDHAIMEYYPAHTAYQNVKRTGFRTFLRKDGSFYEPFEDESKNHTMRIEMNRLEIQETDPEAQVQTTVSYTILPEERIGALLRKVTIQNTGKGMADFEFLDGMPAVIPYGVEQDSLKNMTQTAKAWMQAEQVQTEGADAVSYFRVRASMADSAEVTEIAGGNFGFGTSDQGEILSCITDPEAVFSYDNSLTRPVRFMQEGLSAVTAAAQNVSNIFPCCFFVSRFSLNPGESRSFYELIGQVENQELLKKYFEIKKEEAYFEKKIKRASELSEQLSDHIRTETGNPVFDAYCRYTYMDNVLRGGYPIPLGHNHTFYVYSRKHGDLERDYNYFSMLPEYYSQGNGNFRDVNQNRRMDSFFSPFVGRENIHTFYSLIQLDGYNPLGVEKKTYLVSEADADMILSDCEEKAGKKIRTLVTSPFTPGKLYLTLADLMEEKRAEQLFASLIDFAEDTVNGNFLEGYWSDHWDYNLDLIEEYLAVYPEKEQEMLYENTYTCFVSQANINPRARRYERTDRGIRQYHALNSDTKRCTEEKLLRKDFGKGDILYMTLAEKLLLLAAAKFAALDPCAMGIEMEGGKPGWYDALNGLPGMLGSSVAESCELERHLDYTIHALQRNPKKLAVLKEVSQLINALQKICMEEMDVLRTEEPVVSFWNRINDVKENYREITYTGVTGEKDLRDSRELVEILKLWKEVIDLGLEKAWKLGEGILPAYFTYEVTRDREDEQGIHPEAFRVHKVPCFLEGPVRYMKLALPMERKQELYRKVKESDLYDTKLSMYKVNASLSEESFELGRARAFTPGWLENESIWLHMEYKYLLELIKSGLYAEFFEDFHKAAIPFLDEEIYGRSVLENSSFIASSKNPNPSIHGKGFVARLSGSTVEFLNLWKIMMFGKAPFVMKDGSLRFSPNPAIPAYLIGEDKTVTANLLGNIPVTYHFAECGDYYPGNYRMKSIELTQKNGVKAQIFGSEVTGRLAEEIRNGKMERIRIEVQGL